jgi:rhomboid family GlyGly-CTERM serine protease
VPSSADGALPSATGAHAWVALATLLALAALLASPLDPRALDWQPALFLRQPWRAVTAAFLHFSALHLAANLAGTALVGALGWFARVPLQSTVAWLIAVPLTQVGLLARADLLHYGGLSGVLHAGVACVAWPLIVRGHGARRAIGALTLAIVAIKVASETPWGPALRHPAGWDIATAPFAHASGLVAGVLVAAMCDAIAVFASRRRPGASP